MRISDWSSDVCSSDLLAPRLHAGSAEDWLPQAGAYARLDMHYYEQLRWIQAVLAAHPPRAAERAMFGGADMRPDEAAAIGAAGNLAEVVLPGLPDRKSVVEGKSVSVRVDLGGRRIIQNTTTLQTNTHHKSYTT